MADEANYVDLEAILQGLEEAYAQKQRNVSEPAPEVPFSGVVDGQAQGAFDKAIKLVAEAVDGAGRDTLNKQALILGGIAKAGRLDWSVCRESLLNAVWSWEHQPDEWKLQPAGVIDAAYNDAKPFVYIDLEGGAKTWSIPTEEPASVKFQGKLEDLEDGLWQKTPLMSTVFDVAIASGVAPHRLLHSCLLRALAAVPYFVEVPPKDFGVVECNDIGAGGALNLGTVIVGSPGSNKGEGRKTAAKLVPMPMGSDVLEATRPPASAAAIRDLYWKTESRLDGDMEHKETVRRYAALATVTEVDGLAANSRNQGVGGSIMPALRQALVGEELGSLVADSNNGSDKHVPAGTYRFCFEIHCQPETAGFLLSDAQVAGGTPHRFIFALAKDRRYSTKAKHEARARLGGPARIDLPDLREWSKTTFGPVYIDLPDRLVDYIEDREEQNHRGEGDALDAHILVYIKVCTAVAVLHGSTVIEDIHIDIADRVMACSKWARDWTKLRVDKGFVESAARQHRHREQAKDQAVHDLAESRNDLANAILKAVRELSGNDPKEKVARRDISRRHPMTKASPAEVNKAFNILITNQMLVPEPLGSVVGEHRGQMFRLGPRAC